MQINIYEQLHSILNELETAYSAANLVLLDLDEVADILERITKQHLAVDPETLHQVRQGIALISDNVVRIKSNAMKIEQAIHEAGSRLGCYEEYREE